MAQRLEILVTLKDFVTSPLAGIQKGLKSLADTAVSVSKISAAAIGGITASVAAGAAVLVDQASDLEDLRLQLRGLSNDWQEADARLQSLRDLQDLIPVFDDRQIVQAFVELEALGVPAVESVIKQLGSVAVLFNKDLPAAVNAFQSASKKALVDFGITVKTLTDKVVLTSGKGMNAVRVETEKNIEAIRAGILEVFAKRFPDAIELAVNQFKMKWAGLKDMIGDLAADVGTVLLPAAKRAVDALTAFVADHYDQVLAFAQSAPAIFDVIANHIRAVFRDDRLFADMAKAFAHTLEFLLREVEEFLISVASTIAAAAPLMWEPIRVSFSVALIAMRREINQFAGDVGRKIIAAGEGGGFDVLRILRPLGQALVDFSNSNVMALDATDQAIEQSITASADRIRSHLAGLRPQIDGLVARFEAFKAGLKGAVGADLEAAGVNEAVRQITEGLQLAQETIGANRESLRALADELDKVEQSAGGAAAGVMDVAKAQKLLKDAMAAERPAMEADEQLVALRRLQLDLVTKQAEAARDLSGENRAQLTAAADATRALIEAQTAQQTHLQTSLAKIRAQLTGLVPDDVLRKLDLELEGVGVTLRDLRDPVDELAAGLEPIFAKIEADQGRRVAEAERLVDRRRDELDVAEKIGASFTERLRVARDWRDAVRAAAEESVKFAEANLAAVKAFQTAGPLVAAFEDKLAEAQARAAATIANVQAGIDELEPIGADFWEEFLRGARSAADQLLITRRQVRELGQELTRAISANRVIDEFVAAIQRARRESKSLGEEFKAAATTILEEIERILLKMAAMKIVSIITGIFKPAGAGAAIGGAIGGGEPMGMLAGAIGGGLPAELRAAGAGAGAGGGSGQVVHVHHTHNWNVQALDAASFEDLLASRGRGVIEAVTYDTYTTKPGFRNRLRGG